MNGLVLIVLLLIAPQRAVPADTSIYIENVIWPHASQNTPAPAKKVSEPTPAVRLEPARKWRGVRRP
jgi:hypothetical protein